MSKPNVTMVAFHRSGKPPSMRTLLTDVLDKIKQLVKPHGLDKFSGYEFDQIHATVIGMEVDVIDGQFYNDWFLHNRNGEKRIVDIARFLKMVGRVAQRNPVFTIRFGGFREAYCTCVGTSVNTWDCASSKSEFHSCDRAAYEGSFYAYSPGPVVLTGWPVRGPKDLDIYPRLLYDFRLAAEDAGFLDKYHSDENPHWKDDDCFIKLGSFNKELSSDLSPIEKGIRDFLAKRGPITVDIRVEDISIVLYKEPTLRPDDIIDRVPLKEALQDSSKVKRLYMELLNYY